MAQRITALRGVLGLCTTGTIIASNHVEADSNVSFERSQLPLSNGTQTEKEDGYEVVNAATAKVETPSGKHLCDRNTVRKLLEKFHHLHFTAKRLMPLSTISRADRSSLAACCLRDFPKCPKQR